MIGQTIPCHHKQYECTRIPCPYTASCTCQDPTRPQPVSPASSLSSSSLKALLGTWCTSNFSKVCGEKRHAFPEAKRITSLQTPLTRQVLDQLAMPVGLSKTRFQRSTSLSHIRCDPSQAAGIALDRGGLITPCCMHILVVRPRSECK